MIKTFRQFIAKKTIRLGGFLRITPLYAGEAGSVLLLMIVLMVLIALIGVGMLSLFSSSTTGIFASHSARKAQYLAESGIRYVLSEVRNPAAPDKEATLRTIDNGSTDGKWFQVLANEEKFTIRVYPLYGSKANVAVMNTVTVTVPNSGLPPEYAVSGLGSTARLQIGPNNAVDITGVSGITTGAKVVTFTLDPAKTIPAGTYKMALLEFKTKDVIQKVTRNSGDTPLVLGINSLAAIPRKNGAFMDVTAGKLYTYRTAQVVGGSVELRHISWKDAGAYETFDAGTYLRFLPAVHLDAKGKHRQAETKKTDYMTLFTSGSQLSQKKEDEEEPINTSPPALTPTASGFTNDTSALDLSQSGNKVAIQGYIATGGVHAYWAAFQNLGAAGNRFPDPENTSCDIGYHVAPVSDAIRDNLRNIWMQYNQLNYDIQIKMGWDLNLEYAAQGVTFRWHEHPDFPGRHEGYGLSFLRFNSKTQCNNNPDMIPDTIKPGSGNSMKDNLLLVLWQQKVNAAGVETKDWLAYAELGDPSGQRIPPNLRNPRDPDQKVTGNQGWPDGRLNDNAGIIVRVEDRLINGVRYNDIKMFYTDASPNTFSNDSRSRDAVATNKQRARYYPKWLETGSGGAQPAINPIWPSNQFGLNGAAAAYWYNNLTGHDYSTLVSATPTTPYNTVTLVTNTAPLTGFNTWQLLPDRATIRTADFVLDTFPRGWKEIGLSAMGNLRTQAGYPITVAFDDFYIQILGGY